MTVVLPPRGSLLGGRKAVRRGAVVYWCQLLWWAAPSVRLWDGRPSRRQPSRGRTMSRGRGLDQDLIGRTVSGNHFRSSFAQFGKYVEGYHGTSSNVANLILANGFRPSTGGMLGRGVYWSDDVAKRC